jgi:hypothetical protein
VNLLDENFPEDQRPLLRQWGIRFRQIGRDVGWFGVKDDNVIPLLHERRGVTFFTQDQGFFQVRNCHAAYCVVCLDVRADDTAEYVRRFLYDPRFRTKALRMGLVVRAHHDGLEIWKRDQRSRAHVNWP